MFLDNIVRKISANDNFLLVPKMIFFFLNFILYTTYTYQLDYLRDVWKLDLTTSSVITSIPILSFFSAIGWSSIAQRTGLYKELIISTALLYAICFSSFYLLSEIFAGSDTLTRFSIVTVIYGFMSVLASALFPLLDHKMYLKLSKDRRFSPEMYGRQRLWGTIGQGIAGFVAGKAIKGYGYPSIFLLSGIGSIVFIFLILVGFDNVTKDEDSELKKEKDPVKRLGWFEAMKTLMSFSFMSFLLVVMIASFSRAIVGNFLVRYIKVHLSIQESWSGTLLLIRTFPEILCFYFSKNLIKAYGVNNILFIAQLAGLIRVTAYSWLPKHAFWAPFFIESLRGANNAFLTSSGIQLAHQLSPVESQSVAQGFFHGILGNLTTGLANIMASIISYYMKLNYPESDDAQEIQVIFKFSSLVSLIGLLVFIPFYFISKKITKLYHK